MQALGRETKTTLSIGTDATGIERADVTSGFKIICVDVAGTSTVDRLCQGAKRRSGLEISTLQ